MSYDKILYCAVRGPVGEGEYLDLGTLAGDRATARELAEWHERDNRAWAKANPVTRTAKVRVVETEEVTGKRRDLAGQHTPGPWEALFEGAAGPDQERWRVISPAALTVATVAPGRCAEANARLLAAAPALLQALIATTTALIEWSEDLSDTNERARLALIAEANAALALVTEEVDR